MYWVLVIYFVAASLVSFVDLRRSLFLFLYGYAALPFATALGPLVYEHGLFAFDFYFFLTPFALLLHSRGKMFLLTRTYAVAFAALMGFLCVSAFVQIEVAKVPVTGTFLLDLRVPLVAIEAIILYNLFRKAKIGGFDEFTNLAIVSSIAAIIYWAMNCKGLFVRGDAFYDVFNRYRLWTSGSMISMLYLLYWFVCPPQLQRGTHKHRLIALLLCCVAAVVPGERALLGFLVMISIMFTPYVGRRLLGILFIGLAGTAFVGVGFLLGVHRITSALSVNGMLLQLAMRFSPAYPYLTHMGAQFFYGFGFGTSFNIPWFNYQGLAPDNSTLDSMYLTYFVKFGLMSLLMLYVYVQIIMAGLPRRVAIATAAFFLLPGITYAVPAHPLFVAYPICAFLIATSTATRERKLRDRAYARAHAALPDAALPSSA